jgi:hypothetical protein
MGHLTRVVLISDLKLGSHAGAVRAASPARFRLWGRAPKAEEAEAEAAAAGVVVQVAPPPPHARIPFSLVDQQSMVTRFAASLRTGNSPQRKEARPLSHALTSD